MFYFIDGKIKGLEKGSSLFKVILLVIFFSKYYLLLYLLNFYFVLEIMFSVLYDLFNLEIILWRGIIIIIFFKEEI